jgi:hypothetical protein
VKGIEPSYVAWEATVLPLNYTRKEFFDCRLSIFDLQAATTGRYNFYGLPLKNFLNELKSLFGKSFAFLPNGFSFCANCI